MCATFHVRALTHDDAVRIAAWRYGGPWATYDLASSDTIEDELPLYTAIVDSHDVLHAFSCVDSAARVPGLEPDPRFLDVGIGLDPELVGKGRGSEFGRLVMRNLEIEDPAQRFRAVVQSWNERSLRLGRRLGFTVAGTHSTDGTEYAILVTVARNAP
jgi:[ribosomal protein S18]-alanine N-acetyltransferase